jgi:hypothetical protein
MAASPSRAILQPLFLPKDMNLNTLCHGSNIFAIKKGKGSYWEEG